MVLSLVLAFASPTAALPPFTVLFKSKYGYKPSCELCHEPDHWDNNEYGKLFLKNGRSLDALAKIEDLDPDKDGVKTLEEIKAKANPGDPRSTPKKPGRWLEKAEALQPPRKPLAAFFPDAGEYQFHEAELGAEARARLEKKLGRPLRDEERYLVYFDASSGGKLAGRAVYAATPGAETCMALVGVKADGTLAGVRVLHCHDRSLKKEEYTSQFAGRRPDALDSVAPSAKASAAASKAIVESVRAAAEILQEAAR